MGYACITRNFFRRVCMALSDYFVMTYVVFWRYAVMHFMHEYARGWSAVESAVLAMLMAKI
jgi:hypothetical protein